jgi:hypothetical protein
MKLDASIVRELRIRALDGALPSQLVLLVGRRLNLGHTKFRLLAIAYFREAFGISLADAKIIGAASIFPGGQCDDADLNRIIEPIIKSTRPFWEESCRGLPG